ncbi:transmembrane protein 26-like [Mytilus galloprovincialis]|uniref:transmembrane protein 26-like n=1 Tax=Mytilus galloprovincialis TaxID=29158 RepID=UPI003F7C717E
MKPFFNIVKAIMVRLVLLVHSLLAIWRVVNIANDMHFWYLAIADGVFLIEGLITIIARKGMEYKWFCPCFFFYLCSTIPAIWLLELDRRDRFVKKENSTHATDTNSTKNVGLPNFYGVSISIQLEPDTWVVIIEQLLLYFMIIGRWLLPRGNISRNELSQLLFVFIGMASDITELFTLFDEKEVRENLHLTFAVLIIWTLSLLQFCFVLTATRNVKRGRVALQSPPRKSCGCSCCSTEVWSILVAMLMQDIPFVTVRLYTIATYNLINYSIIFFTAKNILVVMLLLYRFAVILGSKKKDDGNKSLDSFMELGDMELKVDAPKRVSVVSDMYQSKPYPKTGKHNGNGNGTRNGNSQRPQKQICSYENKIGGL